MPPVRRYDLERADTSDSDTVPAEQATVEFGGSGNYNTAVCANDELDPHCIYHIYRGGMAVQDMHHTDPASGPHARLGLLPRERRQLRLAVRTERS